MLQKFGGMGDDAMEDIDESDDDGMCIQCCGWHFFFSELNLTIIICAQFFELGW